MSHAVNFIFPEPNRGGRVVLSDYEYGKLKLHRWRVQGHCCARCDAPIDSILDAALHHLKGRGLGGCKRDDRLTVLVCGQCHAQEHS